MRPDQVRIFDEMLAMLEREHEALAATDLEGVISQSLAKLALLKDIEATIDQGLASTDRRVIEARLQGIIAQARANARAFDAVRAGITSAVERLGRLASDAYVGAYAPTGAKLSFSGANGQFRASA